MPPRIPGLRYKLVAFCEAIELCARDKYDDMRECALAAWVVSLKLSPVKLEPAAGLVRLGHLGAWTSDRAQIASASRCDPAPTATAPASTGADGRKPTEGVYHWRRRRSSSATGRRDHDFRSLCDRAS